MDILLLLGAAQAFFMTIFLFNKKGKTHADYLLEVWLIFMGIHLLYVYLWTTGFLYRHPHFLGTGAAFNMLEGVFMYVYVLLMLSKTGKLKLIYLLHTLPFITFTIYYMFEFYFLSADEKLIHYENIINEDISRTLKILSFPNMISVPIYVVISLLKLRSHSKNISARFSYTEKISLNWLKFIVVGLGIFTLSSIVGMILESYPFVDNVMHYQIGYLGLAIAIFLLGYYGIRQQAIYKPPTEPLSSERELTLGSSRKKVESRYLHSGLKDNEADKYRQELLDFFNVEKPYLNGKLSLQEVAEHLDVSVNHLSQVINEKIGKTFFDFVNDYRIEEVKIKLANFENQSFTILALAFDSGFNSKSSFNNIFKKSTGVTPSQYVKMKTQ